MSKQDARFELRLKKQELRDLQAIAMLRNKTASEVLRDYIRATAVRMRKK